MKKYDEGSVVRALSKNPTIEISYSGKLRVINIVKGATTVGNSTWGKIDFLVNYCNYSYCFIDVDAKRNEKLAEIEAKRIAKRAAIAEKRKDKIDIITPIKSNLGKIKFNRK